MKINPKHWLAMLVENFPVKMFIQLINFSKNNNERKKKKDGKHQISTS